MYQYLLIFIFLIIILFYTSNKYEHFYEFIPYNITWSLDKCLTGDCVIKKSYDCYKYCKNINPNLKGAQQQCEMDCLDNGDEMFDYLKYQNYNWPLQDSNKYFKRYTILNDTDDYVNLK